MGLVAQNMLRCWLTSQENEQWKRHIKAILITKIFKKSVNILNDSEVKGNQLRFQSVSDFIIMFFNYLN